MHIESDSKNDKNSLFPVLHINRGLLVLPESIHLKLSKAECFMRLGKIEVYQNVDIMELH